MVLISSTWSRVEKGEKDKGHLSEHLLLLELFFGFGKDDISTIRYNADAPSYFMAGRIVIIRKTRGFYQYFSIGDLEPRQQNQHKSI